MATFKETCELTSRKDVSESGRSIPDLAGETSSFLVTFLLFGFRKTPVKSKFSEFLIPLRDVLVANFIEMHAPISKKYVVEKGIVMPN